MQRWWLTSLNSSSDGDSDGEETDDEEEEENQASKKTGNKFLPTLSHLKQWYDNQHSDKSGKRPPLILVLEDFEGFSSQVLRDLISNLK